MIMLTQYQLNTQPCTRIVDVTGPRKHPLTRVYFSKLQNDTKIDLLAIFYPEICSRERYEGIANALLSKTLKRHE